MSYWAVVENGVVANVVRADSEYATKQGWIAIPDGYWIGDIYQGGAFSKARPSREQAAADARAMRDLQLRSTVDTLNPIRWESMPESRREKWRSYRQQLLDVPQQTGFPWEVEWPVSPADAE